MKGTSSAAGLLSMALAASLALPTTSVSAGPSGYDTFCRAGDPTPKYICDALKKADAQKPATPAPKRKLKS